MELVFLDYKVQYWVNSLEKDIIMGTTVEVGVFEGQYEIAASTTASAAQLLAIPDTTLGKYRLQVEAEGAKIFFKFGDSTVVASPTVTSNKLAGSNFSIASGQNMDIQTTGKYVSVITRSGTGTAIIKMITA